MVTKQTCSRKDGALKVLPQKKAHYAMGWGCYTGLSVSLLVWAATLGVALALAGLVAVMAIAFAIAVASVVMASAMAFVLRAFAKINQLAKAYKAGLSNASTFGTGTQRQQQGCGYSDYPEVHVHRGDSV